VSSCFRDDLTTLTDFNTDFLDFIDAVIVTADDKIAPEWLSDELI
jgi:hypothetical protein